MRFSGNQPRIMHFGRVKVGDRYSVSPEATLGPTPKERVRHETSREKSEQKGSKKRAIDERLASDKLESKRIASQRIQEFEGSRVRARQWCNTDGEVGNK
jgi:hypothetical protein